eukprot:GEZU01007689.1.p1 GENE.GEZU01007689.1~~GEZU01007689.1.p1  ORF type:complete len:116 (-),score=23.95 GEZU01007689.1:154-501(-)
MPINRQDAEFALVKENPSIMEITSNIHFSEWLMIAAVTPVCAAAGYIFGKHIRTPSAILSGWLGASGAFAIGYQNSAGRLLGFKYNKSECEKYGVRFYQRRKVLVQETPFDEVKQ